MHFNKDMNNLTLVYLIPQATKNKLCKFKAQTCLSRRSPASQAKGQLWAIAIDSKADQENATTSRTAHVAPASAGLYSG